MNRIPTIARYLLGLIFVVFGLNYWLQFLPMPPPEEGSASAAFIGALYGSGFLAFVKVLEVAGGALLLSGRFVNLGLALLGPIVVNIALYHVFLVKGDYLMAAAVGVLALAALAGRPDFRKALLAPR